MTTRELILQQEVYSSKVNMHILTQRVFNPLAHKYRDLTLKKSYERNEQEKKKLYNERILQIEHGSFLPLVSSAMGCMSRECSTLYSKLTKELSERNNIQKVQYNMVTNKNELRVTPINEFMYQRFQIPYTYVHRINIMTKSNYATPRIKLQ